MGHFNVTVLIKLGEAGEPRLVDLGARV